MQGCSSTVGFDDGAADLSFDHYGVSGADELRAVALVAVGVAGGRAVAAEVLRQALLLPEGSADGSAVAVHVRFLL